MPQVGTQTLSASIRGFDCHVSFTGFSAETDPVMLSRLVGCAAIVNMPAEGVMEALEALRDCWTFYQERQVLPEPTAPVKKQVVAGSMKTSVRAPLSFAG